MNNEISWFCLLDKKDSLKLDIQLHIKEKKNKLYGIVEQAKVKDLLGHLSVNGTYHRQLVTENENQSINELGPVLVHFEMDDEFLSELIESNSSSLGVLFLTDLDFNSVFGHFRLLTLVDDTDGYSNYFRFFDPSIVEAYSHFLPGRLKDIYTVCNRVYFLNKRSAQVLNFSNRKKISENQFIISNTDVAAIEAFKKQTLKNDLHDELKDDPVLLSNILTLDERINNHFDESIKNGFILEEDIIPYIKACLYLGKNFTDIPEVKAIRQGTQHPLAKKQKLWRFTRKRIEKVFEQQEKIL